MNRGRARSRILARRPDIGCRRGGDGNLGAAGGLVVGRRPRGDRGPDDRGVRCTDRFIHHRGSFDHPLRVGGSATHPY